MQINAIGSASSKCVLQTAIILDKQQVLPVPVCGHGTKKPDKYLYVPARLSCCQAGYDRPAF